MCPKRARNASRTRPKRVPNTSRTHPKHVPDASRTGPERVPNTSPTRQVLTPWPHFHPTSLCNALPCSHHCSVDMLRVSALTRLFPTQLPRVSPNTFPTRHIPRRCLSSWLLHWTPFLLLSKQRNVWKMERSIDSSLISLML